MTGFGSASCYSSLDHEAKVKHSNLDLGDWKQVDTMVTLGKDAE